MTDLERRLSTVASVIDWPEADLAGRVMTRIEAGERRLPGSRWIRVALAAAAIALLVLATPAGREAVADLLEVAGIRVGWGEVVDPHSDLDLGVEVTREAANMVRFPLLVPGDDPELGPPDAVYHSTFPPGGAIHLVWESGPELPAAGGTGVGLLYSQFQGWPIGGPGFVKTLRPETDAIPVEVRGNDGFWIEGAPHVVFYEDPDGNRERARLAANVLAWSENGVTNRIETTLGLEFAIELAESLRPMR